MARWVEKGFGFERRHALAKAGGATRAVYTELAELGLAGLAVPEAHGGLGQAMRFVGQQCIQLHGGIGCTDDYVASHYFKRLTMLELSLGDSLHHLGEVSALMQDTTGVFA